MTLVGFHFRCCEVEALTENPSVVPDQHVELTALLDRSPMLWFEHDLTDTFNTTTRLAIELDAEIMWPSSVLSRRVENSSWRTFGRLNTALENPGD